MLIDSSELFSVLGEQTRLRIIMLLLERELCVCDLTDTLALPQSTVSRHLSRLKSAGLVESRRELTWIHYRLADTQFVCDLRALMISHFSGKKPYRDDRKKLAACFREGRCAIPRRRLS